MMTDFRRSYRRLSCGYAVLAALSALGIAHGVYLGDSIVVVAAAVACLSLAHGCWSTWEDSNRHPDHAATREAS